MSCTSTDQKMLTKWHWALAMDTCLNCTNAGSSRSLTNGMPMDACIFCSMFLFPTRTVRALSITSCIWTACYQSDKLTMDIEITQTRFQNKNKYCICQSFFLTNLVIGIEIALNFSSRTRINCVHVKVVPPITNVFSIPSPPIKGQKRHEQSRYSLKLCAF